MRLRAVKLFQKKTSLSWQACYLPGLCSSRAARAVRANQYYRANMKCKQALRSDDRHTTFCRKPFILIVASNSSYWAAMEDKALRGDGSPGVSRNVGASIFDL